MPYTYKILTIIGARPHFIKAACVSKAIKQKENLCEVLVHTGQHYDHQLSGTFFQELDLDEPSYNLGIGSGKPLWQMGKIMMELEKVFEKEQPDLVIVYGLSLIHI